MKSVTKMFIRAREYAVRNERGQTMTEYALILSAVAVVLFAGYQTMGGAINGMLNTIDAKL